MKTTCKYLGVPLTDVTNINAVQQPLQSAAFTCFDLFDQFHGRTLGLSVEDVNDWPDILARVTAEDRVVEVGPGLGSLTLAILETGASVTAVQAGPGL